MKPQTFWQRLARAARDRSFIIGTILVTFFLLTAILGPEAAPYNPYLRDRVQTIDGEIQRAPIPPGSLYPLGTDDQGRDMLSMLLHGARQTLVIAFVAMTVRLLLGLLLGTLSGWWPGSLFDRIVTGLIEFLAAESRRATTIQTNAAILETQDKEIPECCQKEENGVIELEGEALAESETAPEAPVEGKPLWERLAFTLGSLCAVSALIIERQRGR